MTTIEKDPKASGEEEAKLPHKKRRKTDQEDAAAEEEDEADADTEPRMSRSIDREGMPKARVVRLEQNRKAARESRRRKKVMIEELQRSVIFFSRANGTLKQQNEELQRILFQAQAQVSQLEASGATAAKDGDGAGAVNGGNEASNGDSSNLDPAAAQQAVAAAQQAQMQLQNLLQQQQAAQAATQAMYESQGFPPAAARAAAQTFTPTGGSDGAPVPAPTADGQAQPAVMQFDPQAVLAMQQQMAAQMQNGQAAMNPMFFQQQTMQQVVPQQGVAPAPAPAAPAPSNESGV